MRLLCWGWEIFSWSRIKITRTSDSPYLLPSHPQPSPWLLLLEAVLSQALLIFWSANETHWQNLTGGRNRVRVFNLLAPSCPGCRLLGATYYNPRLSNPLQSCSSQLSPCPFGPCSHDFCSYPVQKFNTPVLPPNS